MVQLIHQTRPASTKVLCSADDGLLCVKRLSSAKWKFVLSCGVFQTREVIMEKLEDCAESLHCVTAGGRRGKGRDRRGVSRGTARGERGVSSLT